ncbi:POT family proton-dependent oligopeptide transporter [Mucilaginibacter frigoritolerans]|uniref:POT family proton-dependent oligopeptide transporter n=1 Tax=Mucilaginibacter frigoritolerans TaxID=652788 RepID=A0A562TX03_9SPHI|nr:MFS transporter [Mucilaginibacter frigoritolerans]TWI97636.1 POT family proton-dependent oligopeptide transporter [Mucilaginibacter frigoritolerans]
MVQQTVAADAVVKKSRFPKSVPFIIGNEAAERFSFYGMRSILTLFLVKQFFNPTGSAALSQQADAHANKLNHLFVMVAYALPFVGGMVADWFTGKYKLILYISMVYCLGHLLLSMFDTSLGGFEFGMLVVAIGAGGIKSCVSANVGDQFDASNQDLLSKIYGWFYFSINAGSMLSTIAIPITYRLYGPKWAFGIPGILMALATLIFFLGRKLYVKVPPQGVNRNNLVFITFYALTHIGQRRPGESLLDVAKGPFDPEKVEGMKAVYRVMAVFFFALAFWAVWDQCLSEWTLYAAKSDRNINLGFTSFVIDPGSVSTFNTVFLMIFIVLFNYGLYPFLDKLGLKTTPLRRLGTGLILTALSFVVIAFTHNSIEHGGTPSIWWQILAFMILSAAEVLVSITGLEYAYTHSPKSMKSTMTGLWLLVVSFGNLITAVVNSFIEGGGWWARNLKGANYEWFFVIFIGVFVVAFLFISPRLKERNYITDPYVDNQVIADTHQL